MVMCPKYRKRKAHYQKNVRRTKLKRRYGIFSLNEVRCIIKTTTESFIQSEKEKQDLFIDGLFREDAEIIKSFSASINS